GSRTRATSPQGRLHGGSTDAREDDATRRLPPNARAPRKATPSREGRTTRLPARPTAQKATPSRAPTTTAFLPSGAATGRGRGALEQELALACGAGERRGALELRAGLVEAAELHEQIAADARQEVVALERRLRHGPVDDLESGDRSKGHRDGDTAIQLDDRGGCELG